MSEQEAGSRAGFLRAALSHREFRLLAGGLAVSQAGDWLFGVALVVLVFDVTRSPAWVAAAGILQVVPFALFAPLGGIIADRYDRRSIMIRCDLARALVMLTLAAAAAASAPIAIAIALAFLSTALGTPYRPAVAAMTPSLVGEEDLAAANAVMSAIENMAIALGPAIGGILLLLGSPAIAVALNAVTFLLSALFVVGVRLRVEAREEAEESLGKRLLTGIRAVTSSSTVAILLVVVAAPNFLWGQETVFLVLASERLLGTDSNGVGFLMAAIGFGGILGAALAGRLASHAHPGRIIALALTLPGVALIGLAFTSNPAPAYAIMMLDGLGVIVVDVVAITMLQRALSEEIRARVFGIMDSLIVTVMLLGALLAPVLVAAFALRTAFVVAGSVPILLALVSVSKLLQLDRTTRAAAEDLVPTVELLAGLRIFDGAPRHSLEAIAQALEEHPVRAGEVVIEEGRAATDLFIVVSGTLDVFSSGEKGETSQRVAVLREGDYFGEIGLIERIPTTATVRATTDCVLYRVAGRDFLEAVNQAPAMPGTLLHGLRGRLGRTHPSYVSKTVGPLAP